MKKGSIDPVISILMAATIAVSAFSFSAAYSSADADFLADFSEESDSVYVAEASYITDGYIVSDEETEPAKLETVIAESEMIEETLAVTEAPETEETVLEAEDEATEATEDEAEDLIAETEDTASETIETEASQAVEPSETEPAEQTTVAETTVETVTETEAPVTVETTVETTPEPTPTPAPVTVIYPAEGTVGYEILVLVNNARAAEGLVPLSWSDGLAGAAAVRASESAVLFDHTRPDGSPYYTVSDLIWAENIACGQASASEVFNAWMNSPGHRANIMSPDYRTMGVALCNNGDGVYNYYWAQEFGY